VTEAILVALISGGLSLAGVVVTCLATAKKSRQAMEVTQAVMRTELEELTREVRAHNDFARRMPVVEEQIKGIHRRLAELEGFHRPVH
jgi:Flp pilus assembly protein TadB